MRHADAVVVCTKRDEYRTLESERLAGAARYPIVVDARSVWRQDDLLVANLTVASVITPCQGAWA